jgi:hypothetical protein
MTGSNGILPQELHNHLPTSQKYSTKHTHSGKIESGRYGRVRKWLVHAIARSGCNFELFKPNKRLKVTQTGISNIYI